MRGGREIYGISFEVALRFWGCGVKRERKRTAYNLFTSGSTASNIQYICTTDLAAT